MRNLNTIRADRLTKTEKQLFGKGDDKHGVFRVFVGGYGFNTIATNEPTIEHVSVWREDRYPTREEMKAIKVMFFGDEKYCYEARDVDDDTNVCHIWLLKSRKKPFDAFKDVLRYNLSV